MENSLISEEDEHVARDDPAGPMDLVVGSAIRQHRLAARLSTSALANACGMTELELGACEKGHVRIGAARLVSIAAALGVSVTQLLPPFTSGLYQGR